MFDSVILLIFCCTIRGSRGSSGWGNVYSLFFEPFVEAQSVEEVAAVGGFYYFCVCDGAEADYAVTVDAC